MMLSVALLLLLAAGSCVKSETLTQVASVTVQPGHTLSLPCTVSYSLGSYDTAWIRQQAGKGLEWIGRKRTGNSNYKESLRNKFSIDLDTSSNTVTLIGQNMQPADSAVYYCARNGTWYAFDYWGKGTMVTVASDPPTAPSVFPVRPCTSESGDTVTLTCLATGFRPAAVSFSWTQNGSALSDSLQYPAVLKNKLYSGVSQVRVRRQDWDLRHSFKCRVEHEGGSKEVDFIKADETIQLPSLKIMSMEESNQVTFSCLANDFVPNIFEFKWLKNGKVVKNASLEFTTPSTAVSSDDGTRFSAASFLTLPKETLVDDTRMTCEFSLQRGAKKQQVESVLEYRTRKCSTQEGFDMKIIPPSWEDLLLKRIGEVRCEVTFPKASLVSREVNLSWRDEKMGVLMTPTDPGAQINGKRIILPLDITFEEWNSGVRRTCLLDHGELLEPLKRVYERKDVVKSLKPPSIFMLPPLKQTREGVVTLTCYIKDFYPKELYVSWLIDDKDATHDFRTTGSMEANGAFEAYSRLSVPLSEWDVPERAYSCLVHHESVEQNKSYVRSITQNSPQQTTMVNLNMRISDRCKAQ